MKNTVLNKTILKNKVIEFLKTPDYRGHNLDDPEIYSRLQLEVFKKKKPLSDFYSKMYRHMLDLNNRYLDSITGKQVEIGSGGGFFKEINPYVITSDIRPIPNIDRVFDACHMPFEAQSLATIYSCLCLHHIPQIRQFFKEVQRVLKTGGGLVVTEPYWGPMGLLFFKYFCLENYDPHSKWEFQSSGPMSSSNQALSYIMLKRDRKKFEEEFPGMRIVYQKPFDTLEYLFAGALWGPQFLPTPLFKIINLMGKFQPLIPLTSVFHAFVIKKISPSN